MRITDHSLFEQPAALRFSYQTPPQFFHYADEPTEGGGTTVAEPAGGDGDELADFSTPDGPDTRPAAGGERVEGEVPPNFSALGGPKKPAKPPETAKAPQKVEKPASEAPAKPAAPAKSEPKTPETPKKPAEAPKTPAKAAVTPAKPVEKATEAAKPAAIPSEDEINALQPKPGAPTQVIKDFGQMRTKMGEIATTARALLAEKEALSKEVETLKASTGKLPEEVDKELQGLRHFHMLFNAQQDPVFQKEYDGKITAATEGIYSLLTKHGLKPEIVDAIKKAAEANGGNPEAWPHWERLLSGFKNPVDKQSAIQALQARRDAIGAKTEKLDQLAKDRQGYIKTLSEKDAGEKKQWAKDMETAALGISANAEWAMEKEVPEGASADVKAAIESHNAEVSKVAEAFKANVLGAYNRDPKVTAELAFAGVKAGVLEKQVATHEATIAKRDARIAELEATINKIKGAGRLSHSETPAEGAGGGGRKTTVEDGKIGGDGASAIRSFKWGGK